MGRKTSGRVEDTIRRSGHHLCIIGAAACLLMGCDPGPTLYTQTTVKQYPRVSVAGIEVQAPPDKVTIRVVARPAPVYSVVRVRVSAYCPCARCCGRMTGQTSTQTSAWVPGVAADQSWLTAGTRVEVPGYGRTVVDDTGGRMKKKYWNGIPRLDVRFTYHWEARQWGIQYLDCRIFH